MARQALSSGQDVMPEEGGSLLCVLHHCAGWEGMEGVVQAVLFDLSFNTAPEFMLGWDDDGLRLQSFPA